MPKREKAPPTSKAKARPGKRPKQGEFLEDKKVTKSVYHDFVIRRSRRAPKWHPVKKMRYVFFRMIGGATVTDALREIHWPASEFWYLLDLKRESPFQEEYTRAKKLQGRAFGDTVAIIAEGRDIVTKRGKIVAKKLVLKALRHAGKTKSKSAMRTILNNMMASLDYNEAKVLNRNKVQIDAAKWIAKAVNPGEFGDKSSLALGTPDGSGGAIAKPITIQFIGPDGKVVPL
jgi:hypothetical protein